MKIPEDLFWSASANKGHFVNTKKKKINFVWGNTIGNCKCNQKPRWCNFLTDQRIAFSLQPFCNDSCDILLYVIEKLICVIHYTNFWRFTCYSTIGYMKTVLGSSEKGTGSGNEMSFFKYLQEKGPIYETMILFFYYPDIFST